jgi:glycosyltransferase involved in cell wall biosynthesis
LGYTFMDAKSARHRLTGWLARSLYRLSLRHSHRVFFQNPDDRDAFLEMKLVSPGQSVVVNGSGVDLAFFPFRDSPDIMNSAPPGGIAAARNGADPATRGPGKAVRFLLIARLLRDKGIGEYVAAARWLKRSYPHAEFHLIGAFDPNPAGLKPEEVRAWEDEGLIQFHGWQADVRPFIRECHVYVLPSYREGTPRTVLEAMATGRAVITTDAPGCRETVLSMDMGAVRQMTKGGEPQPSGMKIGRTGVLVPVKNVTALAAAMEFFVQAPDQVVTMGREGRRYAEARYDVRKVNAVMMNEMGLEK